MKTEAKPRAVPKRLTIPIKVGLRAADMQPPDLEAAGVPLSVEAIRLAVARYAERLVEDLGLPADVPVVVEAADDTLAAEFPFALTVGGSAARLDLRGPRDAVIAAIPRELYRNRALLITPEVARRYGAFIWPRKPLAKGDIERLTAVMRCCIERNAAMRRLTPVLQRLELGALKDCWEQVFATHSDRALRIEVEIHHELRRELEGRREFDTPRLVEFQKGVFERLALLCPLPVLQSAAELSRDEWQCRLNDVHLPVRKLDARDPVSQMLTALRADLLREPQLLFTRDGVKRDLDFLSKRFPALVDNVQSRIGLNVVCRVLQGLVCEGFRVRNIGRVLDMLTFARGTHQVASRYIMFGSDAETFVGNAVKRTSLSAEDYLRAVRARLKRDINYRYVDDPTPGASPSLSAYLLDAKIEERIQEAESRPLTPAEHLRLVRALLRDVRSGERAVVLTTEDVRAALWALIHSELPDVTVLAYQDLSPHCNINALARISLD